MKKINDELRISRRKALGISLGVAGAALFTGRNVLAAACGGVLTPRQALGPFYPEAAILNGNNDNDLTRVHGRTGVAQGELVYIEGTVTDRECRPIANAVVDIWQANHEGRYNHSLDASNPRPLDPNFQSRGIALTDSEGRYNFKSIIPGAYPASADWMRPSHVHFRVSSVGFRELTTQMYFQGTPYLNEDRILQSLSPEERQAVVIDFAPRALNNGEVVRVGIFPIILQRI